MVKAIEFEKLVLPSIRLRTFGFPNLHLRTFASKLVLPNYTTHPKPTPTLPSEPPAKQTNPPNTHQLRQTFAIKQDSKAFFLQAKAVRKNKYSTVKSALWHSQHQTIGRKYNTQQPALRQDAYSIAISDYEKVEIPYQKYHISTTQGEGFALLRRCYPSPTSISEYQS